MAKPLTESAVPPASEATKPALAAPSSAAAAFLTSIGGRFSSGGTIQPEPEGMQKASEVLEPPAKVQQHPLVDQGWTHSARCSLSAICWEMLACNAALWPLLSPCSCCNLSAQSCKDERR